jgi:very-short-patch-repair endonuclease
VSGCGLSIAPGPPDGQIEAIGRAQRIVVERAQLLHVGVSRHAIDRRLRSGRLVAKHAGVYFIGAALPVEFTDETAALLACGPTAMLSHHSAAVLWGLRPGIARPIHVLVPTGHFGAQPHGVVVHRSAILEPRDIRIHNGLPVTSPARVMLDIAATLPERDLSYVLEEGLQHNLLKERDIYELLRRSGCHPGRWTLTATIAHRTGNLTESAAQRKLLELIHQADLPRPETEVPLLEYRADLFWRDLNLVVEVDGHDYHSTRNAIERDNKKDARLKAAGYAVIRFTAREIEYEPLVVIAQLAQIIIQARKP